MSCRRLPLCAGCGQTQARTLCVQLIPLCLQASQVVSLVLDAQLQLLYLRLVVALEPVTCGSAHGARRARGAGGVCRSLWRLGLLCPSCFTSTVRLSCAELRGQDTEAWRRKRETVGQARGLRDASSFNCNRRGLCACGLSATGCSSVSEHFYVSKNRNARPAHGSV